jgi:hypothetical protein
VIHVVQLERQSGGLEVLYTPILLVEGAYIGWSETFSLTELASGEPSDDAAAQSLLETVNLRPTSNGRRVTATFTSSVDGTVSALEIGILPVELVRLSDEIRDRLLDLDPSLAAGDISSLADDARAEIINLGLRMSFNPTVVSYLAGEAEAWILDSGDAYGGDLDQLAADLRDYTIDLVSGLFAVDLSYADDNAGLPIIEIDVSNLLGNGDHPAANQVVELRRPFQRPAPAIGEGAVALHTSPNGREVAVSWYDASSGVLTYVESNPDGWDEPRELAIGDELGLEDAYRLLEQRLD